VPPRGFAPAFDVETAGRLRAAIGKLSRRLRPTSAGAKAGLTPTRISVLFTVARVGPIRLSDLAAQEGVNPTMLSRVVADFCEAGLVERLTDPGDGRAALVKVTAEGRRLCERMRRERTDALNLELETLSDHERRLLDHAMPVLEKLAEQLKERRR
jgi:DNA-binding MarR family transcriptional regulator